MGSFVVGQIRRLLGFAVVTELEKQLNEILGSKSIVLEQEIEKMKKLIEAKPITRKLKLFGITILKIE